MDYNVLTVVKCKHIKNIITLSGKHGFTCYNKICIFNIPELNMLLNDAKGFDCNRFMVSWTSFIINRKHLIKVK